MKGPMLMCSFVVEMLNTKENPFLFVITPTTNIPWTLPAYFCDVHDTHKYLECKFAEFSGIEHSHRVAW